MEAYLNSSGMVYIYNNFIPAGETHSDEPPSLVLDGMAWGSRMGTLAKWPIDVTDWNIREAERTCESVTPPKEFYGRDY